MNDKTLWDGVEVLDVNADELGAPESTGKTDQEKCLVAKTGKIGRKGFERGLKVIEEDGLFGLGFGADLALDALVDGLYESNENTTSATDDWCAPAPECS